MAGNRQLFLITICKKYGIIISEHKPVRYRSTERTAAWIALRVSVAADDQKENEVMIMMNQLKKSCFEVICSIGGYRLQEWTLENQRRREVRRLIRKDRAA